MSLFMRNIKFQALKALDRFPTVKKRIKFFIKILQFPLIYKIKPSSKIIKDNIRINECYFDENIFQGYFAKKITFEEKILYHKILDDYCELYEYCLSFREPKLLARSRYWNNQQGMMAEYTANGQIMCNASLDGNQNVVKIDDCGNWELLAEGYVFQSVSREDWICLVDLCPINSLRPEYGYSFKREDNIRPKEEALIFYNLRSKDRWALKLADITDLIDTKNFNQFELNHFQFNTDSNVCIGLLRAYDNSGRCASSLFQFNPDFREVQKLVTSEVISHYTWLSDTKIVYWGTNNGTNRAYWIVDTRADKKSIQFLNNLPDGHPVRISDDEFITDTYPDKYGLITLYKCNLNGNIEPLMTTPHPWEVKPSNRCDAHPKYDHSKNKLYIDVREGTERKIMSLSGL